MVQEYVSPVRVHKYTFEMVMAAYEMRFPSCSQIPVVVECIITEDSWSADNSQRHTTRRCQLNVEAPYLIKKMIGVDCIYFLQKNHLDLKNRVLEIEATNESFAHRVSVLEKCRYFVHPENPEWTCFEQTAALDVKNFLGLEGTIEKIGMKQYAANIAKGSKLIDSFIDEVYDSGVTALRPWDARDLQHNRELRRVVSRGVEPLSPQAALEPQKHPQPGTSAYDSDNITESLSKTAQSSRSSKDHSPSGKSLRSHHSSRSLPDLAKASSSHRKLKGKEPVLPSDKVDIGSKDQKVSGPPKGSRFKRRKSDSKKGNMLGLVGKRPSPTIRQCYCPPERVDASATPWDNILMVVVCVVAVIVVSAPMAFFMRRMDRR